MSDRRVVARGGKLAAHHTMFVQYSLNEQVWHPRTALEAIQEFDPDAHNKEREEAYGPADLH